MEGEKPGGGSGSEESVRKSPQIMDLAPTEWTDEKHNKYLNSMEASFIKQFYNSEHESRHLLGWLPYRSTSRLISNHSSCNQFKVLCSGYWERFNFERTSARVDIENGTHLLFENPWVKHFTSRVIGKELHQGSLDYVENNELASQAMQLASPSSKENQPCCSQTNHEHSFRSSTEMSDQNFVDKVSQGERINRKMRTKRAKMKF